MRGPKLNIRMAKNDEGDVVADLVLRGSGFGNFEGWDIDWSDIEPYWILAEDNEGKVLGVIQFCPGKPVARLEMLGIDPDLRKRVRARVAVALTDAGIVMARMAGIQCLAGIIPYQMDGYQLVAEHRGWTPLATGRLNYKRIV